MKDLSGLKRWAQMWWVARSVIFFGIVSQTWMGKPQKLRLPQTLLFKKGCLSLSLLEILVPSHQAMRLDCRDELPHPQTDLVCLQLVL